MSFPFLEKESLTTIMGWAFTALRVWNCQKSGLARTIAEGLPREAAKYITSNFLPEYKSFDIIKGYRADDSYFSYASDFVNNTLSLNDLGEAMRLGKLGEQVVLKSRKAFEALAFVEAIEVSREEYYAKYKLRDEEARNKYRQIAARSIAEEDTYVMDIIRNNRK